MQVRDRHQSAAGVMENPFLDRAPSWLFDGVSDSYMRLVFDEACFRSAQALFDSNGRIPDVTHDLREWWEVFIDYLFVAADSTLDAAEVEAEREDAAAVRRLAEHFQARFATEFEAVLRAAKAALGTKHVLDNLGRAGAVGTAAAQAIKDRLAMMMLDDLATPNLYTSDGEPVTSAAQLANSLGFGTGGGYDQVRSELREWLDCDMDLGEELLEIVEWHVGKVTDDEDERQDIGRSLVDEAVVFVLGLIERWARDEAAAAEADLYVAGLRLAGVAESIADGQLTLTEALSRPWSTSQQCVLALIADQAGEAPEPYDCAAEAWRRLDDPQRTLVKRLTPAVVERWGLE